MIAFWVVSTRQDWNVGLESQPVVTVPVPWPLIQISSVAVAAPAGSMARSTDMVPAKRAEMSMSIILKRCPNTEHCLVCNLFGTTLLLKFILGTRIRMFF
jgi:hypothetical protein